MRLPALRPATILLSTLVAAAIQPLRSQEPTPERASFYLLLRGDTIFEERENRTPTQLSGEFRDRLRNVRVTYDATLNASALVTHVDLRTFRSPQSAGDPASFTIDADSIVAKIGDAAPAKIPSISGAVAVVNPAVGFIEQIVLRARAIGNDPASVMVFVIGGPQPLAGTVHPARRGFGAGAVRERVDGSRRLADRTRARRRDPGAGDSHRARTGRRLAQRRARHGLLRASQRAVRRRGRRRHDVERARTSPGR